MPDRPSAEQQLMEWARAKYQGQERFDEDAVREAVQAKARELGLEVTVKPTVTGPRGLLIVPVRDAPPGGDDA